MKKSDLKAYNSERKSRVMGKTLPIKDIGTINSIRQLYIKRRNYRDLLIFLLSINTGFNLMDLLDLKVGDVKNKYNIVLKNKCSVPISDEVRELIKIVCADRKNKEPLFINFRNTKLDRTGVFHNFKNIGKELALGDEISVASFRKTFGYFYYQKYKDLSFLQWLFNQNTVEQTLAYIDVEEDVSLRLREGVCL